MLNTSGNEDPYFIEQVNSSHYPLLSDLFENAFGSKPSLSEIKKRFDTGLLGRKQIGFIAIHRQHHFAVAYYGVFPVEVVIDGKIIQAAQSGDTMTHSQFRGKGLFVKLAKLTYQQCKEQHIDILFGQPNKYSYHGLVNTLGWRHLENLNRWALKLKFKTIPWPKILVKMKLWSFYLKYARFILQKKMAGEITSFQNPINTEYGKVRRDKNYLNYKEKKESFFIRIDNIVLWIRLTDVFWIGEFSSYEISSATLKKVKKLAFYLGYNTITFNINESMKLNGALQSFKVIDKEASCFLYLDEQWKNRNIVLTGADFDTW
jgi:hypothetical protein